jgi:hypothetical protein
VFFNCTKTIAEGTWLRKKVELERVEKKMALGLFRGNILAFN